MPSAEADLGHLKRLLLVEERRQIEALRQDVSALDERLGSENRFCRAVADSLVVALKVAEIEQHRELAGAMAPIVVAGIRREIAESKDIMVEALYPIVGRLVTTAVAQALRQLAEDINRRIESVLSPRRLRLRVRALLSRRPLAELVLVEASQNRIDTLLLLDRASGGVLAASTVQDGRIEAGARNAGSLDLIGGLMAAIVEFANHALSDVDGELRTLDFGGRTVLLRVSPLHVVAAIGRGSTSAGLDASVDRAFLAFLEEKPQDEAAALAEMHGRFLALHGPKPWNRRISALTLLSLVLAAALVIGGVAGWFALRERSDEAGALARLAQAPELAGYPVGLAVHRDRGTLTATALVPDAAAWGAVRRRIEDAFPDLRIEERVAVLAETPEARRTRSALSEGEGTASALRQRLDALAARLDGLAPALDGLEAGRRRDETTARDNLAALGERLGRIERETQDALAQRPSRAETEAAKERADTATALLRAQLGALAARLDGLPSALDGLDAGRKRDEAALRTDLAGLGERLGRIERETQDALAQRPSRDEVARESADTAAALRGQTVALAARIDALAPVLNGLEAGRRHDETTARDNLAALGERLGRIERETQDALAQRPSRAEAAETEAEAAKERADTAAALRAQLGALAARLDGLPSALDGLDAGRKRDEAALRTDLAGLGERLGRIERETQDALAQHPSRDEVAKANAATAARLAGLSASLDTPRRRLLDAIERTAVFFKDDAAYRDPSKAAAALGRLADALRAEPEARLRIVGFGDSLGTAKANLKVGRLRAEKVAADLAGLGVDPARLRPVATALAAPPSDDVGTASAGRRVTFELINPDE